MESFYRVECPKCGEYNYYSNGDESDLTRPDVEAVKCFKCANRFRVDESLEGITSSDPENWLTEDGRPELRRRS